MEMVSKLVFFAFFKFFIYCRAADQLVFLQAVWRHGDRSPIATFPTDKHQEDFWPQGWGQLSPKGMQQHLYLAYNRFRPRYINEFKFLNPRYQNHEVYFTSTDVNRTILSAIAHTIGLYGFSSQAGVDYPTCQKDTLCWPPTFVPVPVHTEGYDLDYILNPDSRCHRQADLWKLVKSTLQFKQFWNSHLKFLNFLSQKSGTKIHSKNLWIIQDSLYIERLYNVTLPDWVQSTFDGQPVYDILDNITNQFERFLYGMDVEKQKDINIDEEIARIRGGSLLWSIIGNMQQKALCIQNPSKPQCEFYGRLKYFAYSAHDTTLAALFRVLGFSKTNCRHDGYPHYSSAVTIELWQKPDKAYYTKLIYWPLDEHEQDVTPEITGCPKTNGTGCDIETFFWRSIPFRAYPNIATWCATPLFDKKGRINSIKTSWHSTDTQGFMDFNAEQDAKFVARRRFDKNPNNMWRFDF